MTYEQSLLTYLGDLLVSLALVTFVILNSRRNSIKKKIERKLIIYPNFTISRNDKNYTR